MSIIQNLINKHETNKRKNLMKKIQKKKAQYDKLKEDIIKMAKKLRLENGNLVKMDEEVEQPVPQVVPQPTQEQDRQPIQQQASRNIPEEFLEQRQMPEEDDVDTFPDEVIEQPHQRAVVEDDEDEDEDEDEEEFNDQEIPVSALSNETQQSATPNMVVINIYNMQPLRVAVNNADVEEFMNLLVVAMEQKTSINLMGILINGRYIISATVEE